jgi:hypothetical protein
MASSCRWAVRVASAGGSSKTSESRQPPDTTGVEGLRTTPFFGLAPDPDAERLDSDAECRKNIGEELHSHFNYKRDSLTSSTARTSHQAARALRWTPKTGPLGMLVS